MDIQWVIIAQEWRISKKSKSADILGIFNELWTRAPEYRGTFTVLAKIVAKPTEVGEKIKITLTCPANQPN